MLAWVCLEQGRQNVRNAIARGRRPDSARFLDGAARKGRLPRPHGGEWTSGSRLPRIAAAAGSDLARHALARARRVAFLGSAWQTKVGSEAPDHHHGWL